MKPELSHFLCTYEDLLKRIDQIDVRAYDKTRNYLDGSVTWLSPFVTHGVIDTTTLAEKVLAHYKPKQSYRFLFELAWREYFHRTWLKHGDAIFKNLLSEQDAENVLIPDAIQCGETGIDILDECIKHLTSHGSMHNHARMWTAGITCNTGRTQWFEPARWMHYHLLDGDLASNTLSWQWIAGTFSQKQYIANQENLNKFSGRTQKNTWLDCSYEELADLSEPSVLKNRKDWEIEDFDLSDAFSNRGVGSISGDVALRSIWNLDPKWKSDIDQHLLFIDSAFHVRWPLSPKRWKFIQHWLPENTKVFIGTLDQLESMGENANFVRREYPACDGWPGREVQRRWLYPSPEKEYHSYSQFWKQVRKHVGI